ncbi:MAG TPA: hypothetical protein VI790_04615 [Candidatus Nanoarchaeia archaeon]|nr:hypothetical protein [Candidatus Nanoarchaeia archaeon]
MKPKMKKSKQKKNDSFDNNWEKQNEEKIDLMELDDARDSQGNDND